MKKVQILRFILKLCFFIVSIMFAIPVFLTIYKSLFFTGEFSLNGYRELFFDCFIFYRFFWNSILYATVITILTVVISIPAAFSFQNSRFRGKKILFVFHIVMMMMPLQVMILPNYIALRDFRLLNTRYAIILPMIFSPFGVVIVHQYMKSIDHGIIEALRLETSSMIKILIHSVVPQIRICILAVDLFIYAECWNMMEQPLLFLRDDELKTIVTMIINSDQYPSQIIFPVSVLYMIPILLLYSLFHSELENAFQL